MNLGEYSSIAKVWEVYPNGGGEGDFITINSVRFNWNEDLRSWGGEAPGDPNDEETIVGDLTITGKGRFGNDLTVGEFLTKTSGARIYKDGSAEFRVVKVDGLWIKDPITNQYVPLSEIGAGLNWDNYTQKTLDNDDRLALYDPLTKETHYTTIGAINAYIQERVEPGSGTGPGTGDIQILIKDGTIASTDSNVWSSLRSIQEIEKRAISKTKTDTAEKLIKFKEGIEVGTYSPGTLGGGASLKMENGISRLEVDQLDVRLRATFNEVFIKRSEHIGGEQILSGAGMVCSHVDEFDDFFRCYFDNKDGEIPNFFKVGDLAKAQIFNGIGEGTIPDPDIEPIIPLERVQFISANNVGLGRNLIKDPAFRDGSKWNIESYNYNYRSNGAFYMSIHRYLDKRNGSQTLNLIEGARYYFKVEIATEDVIEQDGLIGGVGISFSNTDYNPASIRILGTTPFTEYSGSFIANSPTVVFSMTANNTHTSSAYGLARFRNPIVSTDPDFTGSIYGSESEVLNEAKKRYPLNADYGLPEKLPERTYTPSSSLIYENINGLVIEGKILGHDLHSDRAITLWNCKNVTIKNCKFLDIHTGVAIYADTCENVVVEHCHFENIHRGFIAASTTYGGMIFRNNHVKNLLGSIYGGFVFSQAVQYNGVKGPNNAIINNSIDNILGESECEDVINMFNSFGTESSPLQITGNWIRGGGPKNVLSGDHTGGGITLGDWGGEYQYVENNILVNSGSSGIGIGGGDFITIINNKIYGSLRPYGNASIVLYNWTPTETGETTSLTVRDNLCNWRNKDIYMKVMDAEHSLWPLLPNLETTAAIVDTDLDERILPPNIFVRFPYEEPVITDPTGPIVLSSFFWREVTGVGVNYIELSKNNFAAGSVAPKKGDHIIQLGNKTDKTRQNAIILSSVGTASPMWAFYMGINSFSLEGKQTSAFTSKGNVIDGRTTYVSRNNTETSFEDFFSDVSNALGRGDLRMEIESSAGNILLAGREDFTSTLTAKVLFYINNITSDVTKWKWTRFTGIDQESMDSDALWNFGQKDNNSNKVEISKSDVISGKATFICDATVNNEIIRGII